MCHQYRRQTSLCNIMSSNDVVEQAAQQFLDSLSPDESSILNDPRSPRQVLKDVQEMCTKRNAKIDSSCWYKIRNFGDKLEPYMKGFDLIVQSHPEIAAIVWGAFKIVIILANSYVTFFQKLAEFMERLGLEMRSYERLAEGPLIELSTSLQSTMGELYVAIFDFFRAVISVFRKPRGGRKGKIRIIAGSLWRPFDICFQDIIYRFRLHRDILFMELDLLQAEACVIDRKVSDEYRKRAEKNEKNVALWRQQLLVIVEQINGLAKLEARESMLYRIRQWLDPSSFSEELERAQEMREEHTNEWFWDTPFFHSWKQSTEHTGQYVRQFSSNMAWVRGNPGYGKTVLASSTVKFLQSELNAQKLSQVYYHFFRSDVGPSSTSSMSYRSLLAQILQCNRMDDEMIDRFLFAMEDSSGELHASEKEMKDLIRLCAQAHSEIYIVLDGIDECLDTQRLIDYLLELTRMPHVHCMLFGRPAGQSIAPFLGTVPEECRLNLGGFTNTDVRLFCTRHVQRLFENGLFPPSASPNDLVSHLVTGAGGMFLWARLMVEYLQSYALTPPRRLRAVVDVKVPEGLDCMYDRIMELMFQGKDIEKELAIQILVWVALARRPLTEAELGQALRVCDNTEDFSDNDFCSLVDMISVTCGGMVERVLLPQPCGEGVVPTYRLIHFSAKEYLSLDQKRTAKNAPAWAFWRDRAIFSISTKCLHYLLYNFPSQPTTQNIDPDDLAKMFPLSQYSANHWIDHLWDLVYLKTINTESFRDICRSLEEKVLQFLAHQTTLKAWIECCYVFQCGLQYKKLRKWVSLAGTALYDGSSRSDVLNDLTELALDLERLHAEWGIRLQVQPHIIWEECTAFTPSRFISQNQIYTVRPWDAQIIEGGGKTATDCLARISQTSTDGMFISVLSIWPSRKFELKAKSVPKLAIQDIFVVCQDWTARIEIRSTTDSSTQTIDLQMPLDENMVRHHLFLNPYTGMTQFPLAISPSLRIYVVLREVVLLESMESDPRISTSSFPVDFDYTLSTWWSSSNYPSSTDLQTTPYTYWLFFSPCENFLLFIDESESENAFVIFRIDLSKALAVKYLNHTRQQSFAGLTGHTSPSVSFHPWLRLLSFSCRTLTFLWAFGHDDPKIRSRPEFWNARKIKFADCGSMVVSKGRGRAPKIHTVPAHLGDGFYGERLDHPRDNADKINTLSEPIAPSLTRIDAVPRMQALAHGPQHQTEAVYSSNAISLHHRGLTYGLVRLPKWSGMDNVRPSVFLPQRPGASIRAVLDLSPQLWYSAKSAPDHKLPAVIERHPLPGSTAIEDDETHTGLQNMGHEEPAHETFWVTKILRR